jgi:hypothetical protein
MKKLILILAGAFVSVVVMAQAPRSNQNPNTQTNPTQPAIQQNNPYQHTTDPTILNPAPNNHIQRVDTPAYRQRSDSTYRRSRTDSLPRDDRDPSRIPRMDNDTLRK